MRGEEVKNYIFQLTLCDLQQESLYCGLGLPRHSGAIDQERRLSLLFAFELAAHERR